MESLAQVIEKAVEKQNKELGKHVDSLAKRASRLYADMLELREQLVALNKALASDRPNETAPPAKKPRAAIAVSAGDLKYIMDDMHINKAPVTLSEIVAPHLTNRRKAAALRQLAAEGKVQQVKGGKWQTLVAENHAES